MSFVSLLEVRRKFRMKMRSRVRLVTIFTYGMADAKGAILERKALYWLGWWPAFVAYLHFHGATITPGRQLFNGASRRIMAACECRPSRGPGQYPARRRGLRVAPGG